VTNQSKPSLPPPTPPFIPSAHDPYEGASSALFGTALAAAAVLPGAVLGAVAAALWWKLTRATGPWRWLVAAIAASTTAALNAHILWAWPWRLLLTTPLHLMPLPVRQLPTSVALEAAAGPLLLQVVTQAQRLRERSLGGHIRSRHRREVERDHALSRDLRRGHRGLSSLLASQQHHAAEDEATIELGVDAERNTPFRLAAAELRQHVFVPGAPGSGKSTTLARVADGCMGAGWGVAIVDCKGTGLLGDAKRLAEHHGCPLRVVNPLDGDKTYGYNPCTGDGPDVANKLVGAFSFGADAEIYKNIGSYVISMTVDAMRRGARAVTIASLITALNSGGLADLAADLPEGDALRDDLLRLDTKPTDLEKKGMAGMAARLRALATGRFGPVFRTEPAIDWDADTARQEVVFFALSATGAPEDVALMGRVLAQDIKQLCDRRLRMVTEQGIEPLPLLLMFDEFAALSEAQQVVDLLLQARQARISLVLATQVLPKDEFIRKAAMESGVLIIHRVEAEDAQRIAAQLGTRRVPEYSWTPGMTPEETDRIAVKMVDEYTVHPNTLRKLSKPGRVAIRSVLTDRDAIVQVSKPFE
jgi:hypothetical protein